MDCRRLDITVNSAKGLKDLNIFSKMDLYAVVSIHGDYNKKTHIDKDCGPNPKWNFPMKFTIDINAAEQNRLALVVKIKAEKKLSGDKEVGEVQVPMKELLESFGESSKDEKHATYNVRTPSVKAKGVLDFTYKFGEKFAAIKPKAKNGRYLPQPAYNGGHPQYRHQLAWYPQARCSGYGAKPPNKNVGIGGKTALGVKAGLLGGVLVGVSIIY